MTYFADDGRQGGLNPLQCPERGDAQISKEPIDVHGMDDVPREHRTAAETDRRATRHSDRCSLPDLNRSATRCADDAWPRRPRTQFKCFVTNLRGELAVLVLVRQVRELSDP